MKKEKIKKLGKYFGGIIVGGLFILVMTFLVTVPISADDSNDATTQPPQGVEPEQPVYNEVKEVIHNPPVWRTYKDFNAWWGENRDHATLLAIGKVQGSDYFIHPMSALQVGIPSGTAVVLMTSNSYGWGSTRNAQKNPTAQTNLISFLQGGGVVIVDMGDNDYYDGYRAPGAVGTPSYILETCRDATLDPAAVAANHPIIIGPDGISGTADDLNNSNIDMAYSCYVAHGNLVDGITLPLDATVIMTAKFGGVEKPILAEYCYQGGRVIVDTITKEFVAHQPAGYGYTNVMRNLFSYALSPQACCAPVNQPPTLTFPDAAPYTGDGVDPNKGTASSTPFFFKVIYTDADNDPPSEVELITDNGTTLIRYAMTVDSEALEKLKDGDYANGEQYTFSDRFLSDKYNYYFETSDGKETSRLPQENNLSFLSGLFVTPKRIANIREGRSITSTETSTAARGEVLEILPLCTEVGGENCNDKILVYTPVTELNNQEKYETHYWLKILWNSIPAYVAEDVVMTILPENQPKRTARIMEEIFGQSKFEEIHSFPFEIPLAISAYESGDTLNNEITSVDSPFSGIMQVHPSTSGHNSNCIGKICEKTGDYYTNLKNPFTDLFDISTDTKDGKVFTLKNYINTKYANTNEGLRTNTFDGLSVLSDKFTPRCPKESKYWTDPVTGIEYELTCSDLEKIRAVWAYNGFGTEPNYLKEISAKLAGLSGVFPGCSYPNTDKLIEKLRAASEYKKQVKAYSPVELRVFDSKGAAVGEFEGSVKDEIYTGVYDPITKSIAVFFPDDEYRYTIVGTASETYGLVVNFTEGATTTEFLATDIPIAQGAVHEYTINEDALEQGERGTTLRIDADGDGVFEQTVIADADLTYDEFVLQTETVIDFNPDTLNLKSKGKFITAYIELPEGFGVNQIDISSIMLNDLVTALSKPTEIGDYDKDGVPDLMVKFDREKVQSILNTGGTTVIVAGRVFYNGEFLDFRGNDTIKVIDKGRN